MLGTVEKWTIRGLDVEHPFHIHLAPFQVVGRACNDDPSGDRSHEVGTCNGVLFDTHRFGVIPARAGNKLLVMGSFDEQPGAESEYSEENDADSRPPLVAFAHRYRLVIGIVVAAGMLGLFTWSILALPAPTVPGVYGIVQRYSFPLMCVFIAAVALSWGLKLKSLWTNVASYAAIATYVVYLVVGWVYENFIAG